MTTRITLSTTQYEVLEHAVTHTAGRIEWFPDNVKGGARNKVISGLCNKELAKIDASHTPIITPEGYIALGINPPLPPVAMDQYIQVAADSIEQLRKPDVYRVLVEANPPELRTAIAEYIKHDRPDLADEVDAVLADESADEASNETVAAPLATDASLAHEAQPAEPMVDARTKPRTRANSKQAQVIAMLRQPEGATIPQIMAATGWQAHTIRGTFAGALKKQGIAITSEKIAGADRVYHAG